MATATTFWSSCLHYKEVVLSRCLMQKRIGLHLNLNPMYLVQVRQIYKIQWKAIIYIIYNFDSFLDCSFFLISFWLSLSSLFAHVTELQKCIIFNKRPTSSISLLLACWVSRWIICGNEHIVVKTFDKQQWLENFRMSLFTISIRKKEQSRKLSKL
jgi:hypothetical protein